MTAQSADRLLDQHGDGAIPDDLKLPMGASSTIYRGSLVMLDQSGYAFAATANLARRVTAVATEQKVNSGSAGAKSVRCKRGAFAFANSSSTDAITIADVGQPCYVVDDQTVARTSGNGTRPYAGRVIRIESSKVYVEIGGSDDPRAVDMLYVAGADLSSSQYLAVEMNSSAQVTVANAAGEDVVGILQNAPANGAIAIVRVFGPSRCIASTSINPGVLLATTSAGKSKAAVASTVKTDDAGAAADAVVGSYVFGRALTAGTTDAQHSVFVHPMGAIATTAA